MTVSAARAPDAVYVTRAVYRFCDDDDDYDDDIILTTMKYNV